MRRLLPVAMTGLVLISFSHPAMADSDKSSVGLGVSLGASFPQGDKEGVDFDDWDGSFNWGFHVNIPIIWTFHITPSAELYRFGDANATDISLAFKFILPAWVLDLYAGFAPGLTTVMDDTLFNVGIVGGLAFNLFSNLDMFAEGRYKFLIEGDHNLRVLHLNAGVLFHF